MKFKDFIEMDQFVNYNKWGHNIPCPSCCPTGYNEPPPKNGIGICYLTGQDQKDNQYIYECNTCHKEIKLPKAVGY